METGLKGLIPRALILGEMQNISHEMKSCMRSKDKLGFARKNFASPVSSSPFYSLRKRKKSANSIESLMCSHPSYFGISHTRFRAKNFAVVESGLKAIFHCSRFARAGGASITQLSL
jgi:hypothetical protein